MATPNSDVWTFPVSSRTLHEFLYKELFPYLLSIGGQSNKPRLYFSGEADSNQTAFERLSNNLKVGVVSTNQRVAQALLRFVRIIIDEHSRLLEDLFDEELLNNRPEGTVGLVRGKVPKFTMTKLELLGYLSEFESQYLTICTLDSNSLTTHLRDGTPEGVTVHRRLEEVDLWTITRVMKELSDMAEEWA